MTIFSGDPARLQTARLRDATLGEAFAAVTPNLTARRRVLGLVGLGGLACGRAEGVCLFAWFCRSLSARYVSESGGTVAALDGPSWEGFMGRVARGRLARLLDDAEASGTFSGQVLAPADSLQVQVGGVGVVHFPVRAPLVKELIAVARPAMFGRGEQTLTDSGVRDTWEITPDLVTLGGPAWEATLDAVLGDVRDKLGLQPATRLRAGLHAMLVYGKGQFFLSSCRIRIRKRTTRWWARWWCRCLRRTRAGNWSWSTAAGRSCIGRRGMSCLSSRSTRTAVTR